MTNLVYSKFEYLLYSLRPDRIAVLRKHLKIIDEIDIAKGEGGLPWKASAPDKAIALPADLYAPAALVVIDQPYVVQLCRPTCMALYILSEVIMKLSSRTKARTTVM